MELTLPFATILVEDPKNGGFTAFFREFPDVLAEGNSSEQAMLNLINALHDVLEYKNSKPHDIPGFINSKVIRKEIDFRVSKRALETA